MKPDTYPQQRGYTRLEEERKANKKTGPSPIAIFLLLSLIPVMFCTALAIRYVTRAPHVVHKDEATTTCSTTTTSTTVTSTTATTTKKPFNLTVPYKPTPGTDQHTGDLPDDVEPLRYDITIILNGRSLADGAMNVTGRGEASLKVTKATSKLILKAMAETVKEIKMALLEVPADAGATPKGVNISTLSTSGPYLIAGLEKPLEVGKAYTLVTEYHYDKAAQGGPISLSAEFARMDLYPEEAHAAFPCFEKAGWNIPIALTLQTPKDLVAVSNAPMDGQPTVTGNMNSHKFKATPAMPTDMLAWAVFPTSLKLAAVIPNKVNTYMETEKEDLKASAKTAFEFLHKYFQAADKEHIPKIDLVFAQASEEQESLGFIVLDERTSADKICRTIANQWTYRVMRQPITPTWLASAGVTYLCRLAGTEESKLPAAFKEDLKECMKDNPTPGTRDLLAFRMVHIILGDAATQLAIQKYVIAHVFKSTDTDDELGAFDPSISKENLKAWVKESFKTKHLERALTPAKKITWKEADDSTTPFATATVNSAISLRAPTAVAVAWVKKTNADVTITIDDTKPLYVNPSMMACYGLKLDSLSWSLIGKDMEATPPDVVNAWYLLGEAAKQYKTVQRPGDFSGFMWTWAALKTGNEQLWDEHVKQFINTESQAYSMLTGDETLEEKYKNRIIALIAARLKAITQANIIPVNREKPSVLLANLACAMKMAVCESLLPTTTSTAIKTNGFVISKTFAQSFTDPLSPEAVACYLGSKVTQETEFDKILPPRTQPQTPPQPDNEASLTVRLAFCGCVPSGIAEAKVKAVYDEVLLATWTHITAAAVRVPYGLRKRTREILTAASPKFPAAQEYQVALNTAAILNLLRTRADFDVAKAYGTAAPIGLTNDAFQALEQQLVPDNPDFKAWIDYLPAHT